MVIYYDDLKGNVIKINKKEKYNVASCIKIFILIELFNRIQKSKIDKNIELEYLDKHYGNGSGILQHSSKNIKMETNL